MTERADDSGRAAFRKELFELVGEVRYRSLVRWLNLDPQDEKGALVTQPWLCWRWYCETHGEITIPAFRRMLRVCAEHDAELLPDRVHAPADKVDWVRKFTGLSTPWSNARIGVDPARWTFSPIVEVDVWYCPDCRRARAEAEREGYLGWEKAGRPEEVFGGGPPAVHSERLKQWLAEHSRLVSGNDSVPGSLANSLWQKWQARPEVQQARVEAEVRQKNLLDQMTIRLIPRPSFAPAYATGAANFENIPEEGVNLLRERRREILEQLQQAVERSLHRFGKIEEDSFPYLGCMSGEYYIEEENYERQSEDQWVYRVGIQVRCLGRRVREVGDYCGLDIVLRFTADLEECEEHYSGHCVI